MDRKNLEIQEPCSEDWGDMNGDGVTRHCDKCVKNVHNLSGMTHDDAQKFLAESGTNTCVVYQFDERSQKVRFADAPIHERSVPMGQLVGAKKLVAVAAMIAPLLATGCDTTPTDCASSSDTIRPIDLIVEQEQAMLDALSALFEDATDRMPLINEPPILMGEPAVLPEPEMPLMGAPMMPEPEPMPEPQEMIMGDIAAPELEPTIEVAPTIDVRPVEHEIRDQLDAQVEPNQPQPRMLMGKIAPTRLDVDRAHEYIE